MTECSNQSSIKGRAPESLRFLQLYASSLRDAERRTPESLLIGNLLILLNGGLLGLKARSPTREVLQVMGG